MRTERNCLGVWLACVVFTLGLPMQSMQGEESPSAAANQESVFVENAKASFGKLSLAEQLCVMGFGVGVIILGIGQLLFLASAFGQSVWWGLACLLIPVIPHVAFLLRHWSYARGGYLVILTGGAVMAACALTGLLL